jgi:hypothetical protein
MGATLGGGLSISEPGADAAAGGGLAATTFLLFLAAANEDEVTAKAITTATPRISGIFTINLFMSCSCLVFYAPSIG